MAAGWFLVLVLLIVGARSQHTVSVSKVTVSTVVSNVTVTPTPHPTTSLSTTTHPTTSLSTTTHPTTSLSTTTLTTSQSTRTSHVPSSSTNVPAPTPGPVKDFISYESHQLYLKIRNISITFYSSKYENLTAALIDKMGTLHNDVVLTNSNKRMSFTQYYGTREKPAFYIRFNFTQNNEGGWYLENIQHASLKTQPVSAFLYTGVQYSVWAPPQLRYGCDSLILHGSNGNVTTSVNLTSISAQPFLGGGHWSTEVFDCAGYSKNNETIGLVVGLSLSLAVVIAAIVIIISLLVSKRLSRRGYNLLD